TLTLLQSSEQARADADGWHFVLIGGRASPAAPMADVWLLTLSCVETQWRASWRQLDSQTAAPASSSSVSPQSFPPRWRHTATALPDHRVLVYGGLLSPSAVDPLWYLLAVDFALGAFVVERKAAPVGDGAFPPARHSHSAVSLMHPLSSSAGLVYLSGGLTEDGLPLDDAWQFDGHQLTPFSPLLAPRAGHQTVRLAPDRLLLVGGFAPHSTFQCGSSLELVDLADPSGSRFVGGGDEPPCIPPYVLCGHQAALIPGSGSILLIGGGINAYSFGISLNQHLCLAPLH
ncbi:MAG: kelch repeat-containing protein, partial [archaeon]|nr:kelch repeat-containing protein [archaeon]